MQNNIEPDSDIEVSSVLKIPGERKKHSSRNPVPEKSSPIIPPKPLVTSGSTKTIPLGTTMSVEEQPDGSTPKYMEINNKRVNLLQVNSGRIHNGMKPFKNLDSYILWQRADKNTRELGDYFMSKENWELEAEKLRVDKSGRKGKSSTQSEKDSTGDEIIIYGAKKLNLGSKPLTDIQQNFLNAIKPLLTSFEANNKQLSKVEGQIMTHQTEAKKLKKDIDSTTKVIASIAEVAGFTIE